MVTIDGFELIMLVVVPGAIGMFCAGIDLKRGKEDRLVWWLPMIQAIVGTLLVALIYLVSQSTPKPMDLSASSILTAFVGMAVIGTIPSMIGYKIVWAIFRNSGK